MPIPTAITDLSTTAASNYPQGTDSPSTLDDVQRAHGSFIRQLQTGAVATTANVTAGTITGATINSTSVGATTPSTGSFTTLNSTGGALNGTVGATTPSTGAFTTLSATSGTQSTGVYAYKMGAATGNYYHFDTGTGGQYMGLSAANTLDVVVGGVNTARITNTGLSVTGALSSSGAITANAGPFSVYAATAGVERLIVTPTVTVGNVFQSYNTAATELGYTFKGLASTYATLNSTGLAVTGALSATGGFTNTNATSSQIVASRGTQNMVIGADNLTNAYVGTTSNHNVSFISNGVIQATIDTSGRLLVPNGTVVAPVAFASLPASPVAGQRAMINNSVAAPAFLSTAAGGGSTTVPVFYNGTTWLVG